MRWKQEEDICKDFVLYGGGVHTKKEIVYLCTYANFILPVVFFFFFAETSPGVQFVTAFLGNVVTEKDNIYYNSVICPEDAQKKKSSCCVQHGLWMFLLLLGLQKWSMTQFCHCCSVYVEYEYCVLLESRKRRSKKEKEKKRAIISSYRYVYFHVLYWFLRNGLCLLHFLLLYLCSMQPFVSHREIHKDLFLNICSLSFIWQVSNLQSTEGWTWNWWDIIN